jgi:hypothetical protein
MLKSARGNRKMLTVEGIYKDGKIELLETVFVAGQANVLEAS